MPKVIPSSNFLDMCDSPIKKQVFAQLLKIAKGGGIIFVGNVIGRILHFGLHILIGRVLGTGNYGLYVLGISIMSVARSISSLGLHQGVLRFGSLYRGEKDNARIRGTLISSLGISSLFSIFVAVLLFIFSPFIAIRVFSKPDLVPVIKIFSVALPFYTLITMSSYTARSFHQMQYDAGLTGIFHPVVNIILVGLSFLLGFKLNGALFGFLVSAILSAFLGFHFIRKIFPEIISSLQPIYQIKKLFRFSLPLLTAGVAMLFVSQTDRLMLGWLCSSSDVGIYNAAAVIALQIMLIVTALSASFSPLIADLHNRNKTKEIEQLFQNTTRWGIILSLPIAIVVMLFSKNILMLFGSKFTYGWPILVTLSVAYLIVASRGLTVPMLVMSGKQNFELFNTLVLLILNVILNFWLIKRYGAFGASVATTISISLLSIIRLLEVKLLLGMQPYSIKCLKPLLAGLVTVAIWLLIKKSQNDASLIWIGYIGVIIVAYILLLYLFRFEKEDLAIIGNIKSKLLGRTYNEK